MNKSQVEAKKRPQSLNVGLLQRLRSRLLGYDVFISYSHRDGLGYAMALENRLIDRDLACFRDASELPAAAIFDDEIRTALRRSKMLLVLGSREAMRSEWVRKEYETFTAKKSAVVAVNFDNNLTRCGFEDIDKRIWVQEGSSALAPPQPSDSVISGIQGAITFRRRNNLGRWLLLTTVLLILGLGAGIGYSLYLTRMQSLEKVAAQAREKTQRVVAESRRLAAISESSRTNRPPRLAESAIAAVQAVRLNPTLEGDRALREILAQLPPMIRSLEIPCEVEKIAACANGKYVAIIGRSRVGGPKTAVCLLDVVNQTMETPWTFSREVRAIGLGPNGQAIAVATGDILEQEGVFLLAKGSKPLTLENDGQLVTHFQFHPNGDFLAGMDRSGEIWIWKTATGALVTGVKPSELADTKDSGFEIQASPSGQYLALRSHYGIRIWSGWTTQKPELVFEDVFPGEPAGIGAAPFSLSHDESYVAYAQKRRIRILHLAEHRWGLDLPVSRAKALQFHPDGLRIVSINGMNEGHIWDWRNGSRYGTDFPIQGEPVERSRLSLTPDGEHMVTSIAQPGELIQNATVWELKTGHKVATLFHEGQLKHVSPGREGTAMVTIGRDGWVRYWGDMIERTGEIRVDQTIDQVALSRDDRSIAIATVASNLIHRFSKRESQLTIWNALKFKSQQSVTIAGWILGLSFNTSGGLDVVTGTRVYRWDDWRQGGGAIVPVKELAISEKSRRSRIEAAAFSEDGLRLAVTEGRGIIRILASPDWRLFAEIDYRKRGRQGGEPWATGLALSERGDRVAIALVGGIGVYEVATGKKTAHIETFYREKSLEFGLGAKLLVMGRAFRPNGGHQGPMPAFQVASLSPQGARVDFQQSLGGQGVTFDVDFDSSGKRVAVTHGVFTQVWQLPDKLSDPMELKAQLKHERNVIWCGFSRSGERLLHATEAKLRSSLLQVEDLLAEAQYRLGSLPQDTQKSKEKKRR